MRVGVEVLPGGKALEDLLTKARVRAQNFAPAFEVIQETFERIELQRFAAEGPGWAPLDPRTEAYKQYLGMGDTILTRTGVLAQSLTENSGYNAKLIGPTQWEFRTMVPYAQFHQTGTSKMARRQIVDINPATMLLWCRTITSYLWHGTLGAASDYEVGFAASPAPGDEFRI